MALWYGGRTPALPSHRTVLGSHSDLVSLKIECNETLQLEVWQEKSVLAVMSGGIRSLSTYSTYQNSVEVPSLAPIGLPDTANWDGASFKRMAGNGGVLTHRTTPLLGMNV